MVSNSRNFRSPIALAFTFTATLAIIGMIIWFSYLIFSQAQNLRKPFQNLDSPLVTAASTQNIPEIKALTAKLYKEFPELKALSLTSSEGVIFFSSRHPQIKVPVTAPALSLPPLYLPEAPWEESFSHNIQSSGEPLVLQFVVQVYSAVAILDYLKIMIFVLLGILLLGLVVQLALKAVSDTEEPDSSIPDQEESSEPYPDFTTEESLPDLDPLTGNTGESEEFWYQEEPEMNAETLAPPRGWEEDRLPDLDLPPLDLELSDSKPLRESVESPVTKTLGNHQPTPFDPVTGAVWSEFLEPRLESEIRRAADNNQDLVMAIICAEDELESGERRLLRDLLVEAFPLKDLIFNRGERGFTLLLPQKTLETAMKDLSLSLKRKDVTTLSSRIVAGLSARSGRLLDLKTLMEEAETALEKAGSGHENLIAFKADPDKYRNFLAKAAKE